ncbi:DUF3857 domain-containing transglutaminase family protein [Undibacterium squillarum]|uniref:DUF3857 domain-containing transglutaminase family protein n=1 Tax=Undibacterium squillarum TaxID=1131567 RepID=UPI0035AEDE72
MHFRPVMAFVASCITFSIIHPACAEEVADQGHIRYLKDHYTIRLNADGLPRTERDFIIRAIDDTGVKQLIQQYLTANKDKNLLTITAAETLKADGTVIPVPDADRKVQQGMLGGVSYPEQQLTQMTFPKLAVGDAIHLHYVYQRTKSDLPGGHSDAYYFGRDVIRENTRFTLEFPAALKLQFVTHELQPVQDQTKDGTRQLVWQFENTKVTQGDFGVVNNWQYTPHLMTTTFADWKAIAQAYQQGAAEKTILSEKVRKLTAQLTEGITEDREKARVLYDWVRKNIRYVASYIGDGGMVPNNTDTILERLYGDCKDHATLLEAMLGAAGIEASQVLIDADNDNYTLPPLPVFWFNHAINYLPGLHMYLDSTSDTTPFGMLPEYDRGHPVLITKGFEKVTETPALRAADLSAVRQTKTSVGINGEWKRVTRIGGKGLAAVLNREFLEGIGRGNEATWARNYLNSNTLSGSAELIAETAAEKTGFDYRFEENLNNMISQPEAAAVLMLPALDGPVNLDGIMKRYNESRRSTDFKCNSFEIRDETEMVLAPSLKAIYLPKNVRLNSGPVFADIRYEQRGQTIISKRHFGIDSERSWCAAEEYPRFQKAMKLVEKALEARVLYLRSDNRDKHKTKPTKQQTS